MLQGPGPRVRQARLPGWAVPGTVVRLGSAVDKNPRVYGMRQRCNNGSSELG